MNFQFEVSLAVEDYEEKSGDDLINAQAWVEADKPTALEYARAEIKELGFEPDTFKLTATFEELDGTRWHHFGYWLITVEGDRAYDLKKAYNNHNQIEEPPS